MVQTHHYARPVTAPVGLLEGLQFGAPDWMRDGACLGYGEDWWYSDVPAERVVALGVCLGCPVRELCREWGMGERHGIWGGLTADERRKHKRAKAGGAG